MRGKQIVYADIHRDSGSDSFIFQADDGRQYESFIKSRALEVRPDSPFYPPVISLDSVNSREVVQQLSWLEAQQFMAGPTFPNTRFQQLVHIVRRQGKQPLRRSTQPSRVAGSP